MCHACMWFLDPSSAYLSVWFGSQEYRNSVVKSVHHVRGSQTNTFSRYFFRDVMYFGHGDNTFKQDGGGVYKMTMKEVTLSENILAEMGEPKRASDKEACEETREILEYLRGCLCKKEKEMSVYFFDEY